MMQDPSMLVGHYIDKEGIDLYYYDEVMERYLKKY